MMDIFETLQQIARIRRIPYEALLREYGIQATSPLPPRPYTADDRPLVLALGMFIESRHGRWSGTAKQLLQALNRVAEENGIPRDDEEWPTCPAWLSRTLGRMQLEKVGIQLQRSRTNRKRTVSVSFIENVEEGKSASG
jgi:hypothetical protein